MTQRISLIWAMTKNRVIGKDGQLPWDLPDEMAYFRNTTAGKPVIMGRRTFQSVNRPMPGRLNIVLSRTGFSVPGVPGVPGVSVAADMATALRIAAQDPADECFVIGGTALYAEALPRAARLYATFIDAELDGDTFFPALDFTPWRVIEQSRHAVDERHPYAYHIKVYERA